MCRFFINKLNSIMAAPCPYIKGVRCTSTSTRPHIGVIKSHTNNIKSGVVAPFQSRTEPQSITIYLQMLTQGFTVQKTFSSEKQIQTGSCLGHPEAETAIHPFLHHLHHHCYHHRSQPAGLLNTEVMRLQMKEVFLSINRTIMVNWMHFTCILNIFILFFMI